jgi:hypothetical protein
MAVLEVSGFRFRGKYLLTDRVIGILGRNIINNVIVELNGPNLLWSMRRS